MPTQMSPPSYRGGGMSDLYQSMLTQQGKAEQEQFNRAKGTVASLIDSYKSTKSPGMRKQIASTMRDYYGGLPGPLRKAVDPYIRHSPISATEEKRREFLKYNPPPPEPSIPLGSWKENEGVWEGEVAKHRFAQSDYARQMHIFMFDAASAPEKKNFMSLGNGKAAIRSKDGTVTVLDEQNLGIRETAKRLGLDEDKALQAMYLNNGKYPSGKKSAAIINGTIFDYDLDYNLMAQPGEPTYSRRLAGAKQGPLPPEAQYPKDLTEFVGKLALMDVSDPEIDKVMRMLDQVADKPLAKGRLSQRIFSPEVTQYFQSRWGDYSINIRRTDQGSILWRMLDWVPAFGWAVPNALGRKGYAANIVQGRLIPIPVGTGNPIPVYQDTQGVVRDQYNQVIGTNLAEVTAQLQAPMRLKAEKETALKKKKAEEKGVREEKEKAKRNKVIKQSVGNSGWTIEDAEKWIAEEKKRQ